MVSKASKGDKDNVRKGEPAQPQRRPYVPPRLVKKRAVSRATLFTGSGPDAGGVVGS